MRNTLFGCALIALIGSAGPLYAQPRAIGLVKTVTGEATILREGNTIAAAPGAPLFQGDVLRTGSPGTLGVILRDDTSLSLGARSEVHLAEFTFEPAEGRLGFVLRLTRGVLGYVSGKVAKLAPDATRLETPVATLGIRGTRLAVRVAQ